MRDHKALSRERRLQIARTCTYFNVRKATRILGEMFDEALRPHGLKGTQFSLLTAISLAEEVTVGKLAEILAADRTTLTRTLAPLERDGLIESEPGSDRRQRKLQLTKRGEELLARASEDWERTQMRIFEEMGEENWNDLMGGLREVHSLSITPRGSSAAGTPLSRDQG